jgi:Protein of unknown function (DUF3501)
MPKAARRITPEDILPVAEYEKIRKENKAALVALKQKRRVEVGPYITFYFECYETMWGQIQEMLRIEKGGAEQIADELAAYNPLIPQGRELTCTMMIEIDDPIRRANVLARLGHVEETAFFDLGGTRITASLEHEVERTTADGKTSAVHFLHFPFAADQIARFRDPGVPLILGFAHANYAHMALVSPETRAALTEDFA